MVGIFGAGMTHRRLADGRHTAIDNVQPGPSRRASRHVPRRCRRHGRDYLRAQSDVNSVGVLAVDVPGNAQGRRTGHPVDGARFGNRTTGAPTLAPARPLPHSRAGRHAGAAVMPICAAMRSAVSGSSGRSASATRRRHSASSPSTPSSCRRAVASPVALRARQRPRASLLHRLVRPPDEGENRVQSHARIPVLGERAVERRWKLTGDGARVTSSARCRPGGEAVAVPMQHAHGALQQVAQMVGEVSGVGALEACLRVVGVARGRHLAQEPVAHGVDAPCLDERRGGDPGAERLAHPPPVLCEKAVDHDARRQGSAGGQEHRRPVHGMESEDVLADDVDAIGVVHPEACDRAPPSLP